MFCTNCGKALPEGVTFCTECGTRVHQATPAVPAQPIATQPQPAVPVDPVVAAPVAATPMEMPATPVGKNSYFFKYASSQTKIKALVAWGLTAVCLLIMVIGYIVTMNTSVENIPVISLFVDGHDFDDMKDEMSDIIEEWEDEFEDIEDELEDELSKSEMKLVENLLNAYKKFAKNFSINNTKKLVKSMDNLVSKGLEEELNMDRDILEFREVMTVLNIISNILLVASMFAIAFTVGGGMSRLTPLVAVGLAFSTLNCLLFCGFLIVLLNLAAHICLIVFMTQLNKEYSTYRKSYQTA